MAQIPVHPANDLQSLNDVSSQRFTGMCGLTGGLLFFAGDMLMYGHWGSAADFPSGALAAVRDISVTQLYLGGLVGPIAACLCLLGFWHVYRNLNAGIAARAVLVLSSVSMVMLGAVHVLWVAGGMIRRECIEPSAACTALKGQLNDYWDTAYYLGVGPAYVACALLALVVVLGRSRYPKWTAIFNPALSLLVAPVLAYVPAPWGAPLVGGDANIFIALFFAVSVVTTWPTQYGRAT
jgi:hypothetical protein